MATMRGHVAYLAEHGQTLDQPEFLAVLDAFSEAGDTMQGSERDAALGVCTLTVLLGQGLSLQHPLVQHYVRHPLPQYRLDVAAALPVETAEGRALLAGLCNDPIPWVREAAQARMPPDARPQPWQGLFGVDPNTLPEEAERAAALRLVAALTAIVKATPGVPRALPDLQPDLDALSPATRLDLLTTALQGAGVARPEAKALFQYGLEHDLAPAVLRACWGSWREHDLWRSLLVREIEALATWPDPRRADALFALAQAFAEVYAAQPDEPFSGSNAYLITKSAPWKDNPDRWIDAVLTFAARPEGRRFAAELGGAMKAADLPPARREALVEAWLRGEPAPLAFAGHSNHLGRFVLEMPRAEARALCARALQCDADDTRAWALDAALGGLYDDADGPRDALALAFLEDPKLRALALSRIELVKWFTRPLRRALVDGDLHDTASLRTLVQTLALVHGGDTFGEEYWHLRHPKAAAFAAREVSKIPFVEDGPLTPDEWDAVRRVRTQGWAADAAMLDRSSWALAWLPARPEHWTDDDHTFFAAVLARCDDPEFHEEFDTPMLALALLKVGHPSLAPFVARFAARTKDFDDEGDADILAALRAALTPAHASGATPITSTANPDDDWDDA